MAGTVQDAATAEMAPEAQPAAPDPMMIELISNPPHDELGGSVVEQGSA